MAKSRIVGLDIGTSAVRAVEIEYGSAGPAGDSATLTAVAEVALPPGAVQDGEVAEPSTVSSAIRQLWKSLGSSNKNVVVGVGNQRVVVRDLEMPWLPPAQLKRSLPYQVQEMIPVAMDEVLLDYYCVSEYQGAAGRTLKGLLVAAVKDTVVNNVLAVESAGLQPTMVDLNAFALARALSKGDLAQRCCAFVDIGARITNVVVVDDGQPKFVRVIPSGGQDVTDAVASSMKLSALEAEKLKRDVGVGFSVDAELQPAAEATGTVSRTLVEAIRNSFVFYASQNQDRPIEVLALTGGGSLLPGLGQYLSSATRLPAMLGNPLSGVTIGKSVDRSLVDGREALLTLAVGLARGVAS